MRVLFFLHRDVMPYSPLRLYTMCFFSIHMESQKIVQAVNPLHKSRCGMRFWESWVGVARESQSTGCETHTRSRRLRGEHRGGEGRIRQIHLDRPWYRKYTEPGCMQMLHYLTRIIFTWVLSNNCYTEYEYHIQHITDSCGFFFYSKSNHFTIFFLCCLDVRRIMHSQNQYRNICMCEYKICTESKYD